MLSGTENNYFGGKWKNNYTKYISNVEIVLCSATRYMLSLWSTLCEKCPYSKLFWSAFSCIQTEYGEILCISPYSVRMRENRDQNNSEYKHFLRSGIVVLFQLRLCQMFVIGTSNKLNDESGEGYEHVTVARELSVMDLELLKFINNQVVPGELFYCL